jgi:hypothetical protein
MTLHDIRAVGPAGMPLEMKTVQLWQVREGKVQKVSVFLSEREALKAMGLRE